MKHIYENDAFSDPRSWWMETATPPRWPELAGDRTAHTVIIGGGYTGLNCALELAESHGVDPAAIVVLEARQPGWGASGRNGGFCCMGGSKLPWDKQMARHGEAETLRYFDEQRASIESVRENLKRYAIDASVHSDGETLLAHRPEAVEELAADQHELRDRFGVESELIARAGLAAAGFGSPGFHAALTVPLGFALNPIQYVTGLAQAANKAGIQGFGGSPAGRIAREAGKVRVATLGGAVTADHCVIATNGYSSEDVPPWLAGRLLPVLTNIIVSRPLTGAELAAQGWTSFQACADTRNLLHYFRLMPAIRGEDGPRMLFGMRGGTSAEPSVQAAMRMRVRADFDRFFPAWRQVETPFFWSGLACLTRNLTSYTGPVPEMPGVHASLAYHGNGVAMGSHCGRLIARMIAGSLAPDAIPANMRDIPKRFPLPGLRRTYLKAAYRFFEWRGG